MSDHAVIDNAFANIFRVGILTVGAGSAVGLYRWLNRGDSKKQPASSPIPLPRKILYASFGILPMFMPRPHAHFSFLDETIWGAITHSVFLDGRGKLDWWSLSSEMLMFVGNPGFYSGLIIGFLLHELEWDILWSIFPGVFAFSAGTALIYFNDPHETVRAVTASIGPTIFAMYGPHAIFGYLLGAKAWRFRNKVGEFEPATGSGAHGRDASAR